MNNEDIYVFPASFSQEGIWFIDQLAPNNTGYNMPGVYRLSGDLDVGSLQAAINYLLQRHEALRTTFAVENGEVKQIIRTHLEIGLPLVDLRAEAASQREAIAQARATEEAMEPFDLTKGPLVRTKLLRLADDSHLLLLTVHHIAADGWSVGIIFAELFTAYEAIVRGEPPALPELPIQYVDYAHWQREHLTDALRAELVDYWRAQLEGAPRLWGMPTDYPEPRTRSYRGAHLFFTLPKSLSDELKRVSRDHKVTLFTTLLAAFDTLLHRYCGQTDIVVGAPVANRTQVEVEGVVGLFINTLVMRSDLSGNPRFDELLAQVRNTCTDAFAHQELPFDELVKELRPEREGTRNPLFHTMFIMQSPSTSAPELPGLRVEPVNSQAGTAKLDLSMALRDKPEGLTGYLEYMTDLFDAETTQGMIEAYETLLAGIVANPRARISELPLLPPAREQRILVDWNATENSAFSFIPVHEQVEARARSTPDAIAVVCGDEHLTYEQLDARANRLAAQLRELQPTADGERRIGIYLERSLQLSTAILAVLKSGAAYVPFDIGDPMERVACVLEDSRVAGVLTQRRLAGRVIEIGSRAVLVDETSLDSSSDSDEPSRTHVRPGDLAYVIYTSGSTGTPKGVAMTHVALANLVAWQVEQSSASRGTKTLQMAAVSFDVSFQEMFSTWCSGGTLVIAPEDARKDPSELLSLLSREAIERAFFPVAVLTQLAEVARDSPTELGDLREVITAGEQLRITPPIAEFFRNRAGRKLINQYGPSECHVVTAFELPPDVERWSELPSIGGPITNCRVYVLDPSLRPVPVGVMGELYLGGMQVARGYHLRPDKTAANFIPDPFSSAPGQRLYRTGDRVRWRHDGTLEFAGRTDDQVKVRGFRVELGEVEIVLSRHPAVAQCAVVLHEYAAGDRRLVAYFVTHETAPTDTLLADLRRFLRSKLPEHMVPSAFEPLASLPRTSSGKVDRKALPSPQARIQREDTNARPRSETERRVAAIWKKLLVVDDVGLHDGFFDIGGHSLLATQVLSHMRREFQLDLPLGVLFECQTVAKLAEYVEASSVAQDDGANSPQHAARERGEI